MCWGFPGDAVVKSPPASTGDARDSSSSPGLGGSPGEGNGSPLQYSCLENPMDRGAWWATVHGVAKNQPRLSMPCHAKYALDSVLRTPHVVLVRVFQRNLNFCRKGDPFRGFKGGSCLTFWNELSKETQADKARDFIGKGHLGSEQEGEGTQEDCSDTWLTVLGFTAMGLVSSLTLANCSYSGFFLVAHVWPSQDGCQWGGFWEAVRHVLPPYDISQILLAGSDLLVPWSLPGPPVVK